MSNNLKIFFSGLLALVFFGACSSVTKDEVGRYVPLPTNNDFTGVMILDTKTGVIYKVWRSGERSNYRLHKINPVEPNAKSEEIKYNY